MCVVACVCVEEPSDAFEHRSWRRLFVSSRWRSNGAAKRTPALRGTASIPLCQSPARSGHRFHLRLRYAARPNRVAETTMVPRSQRSRATPFRKTEEKRPALQVISAARTQTCRSPPLATRSGFPLVGVDPHDAALALSVNDLVSAPSSYRKWAHRSWKTVDRRAAADRDALNCHVCSRVERDGIDRPASRSGWKMPPGLDRSRKLVEPQTARAPVRKASDWRRESRWGAVWRKAIEHPADRVRQLLSPAAVGRRIQSDEEVRVSAWYWPYCPCTDVSNRMAVINDRNRTPP